MTLASHLEDLKELDAILAPDRGLTYRLRGPVGLTEPELLRELQAGRMVCLSRQRLRSLIELLEPLAAQPNATSPDATPTDAERSSD